MSATLDESDFPAPVTFKVVGLASEAFAVRIHRTVCRIVGELRDDDVVTRPSKQGNYMAIQIHCVVESEQQRKQIHDALKADPDVMVLQ